MHPLLWLLVGSAATLALTLALVRRQRRAREAEVAARIAELEQRAGEPRTQVRRFVVGGTHDLETLARSVGRELSNLATSVEGHAQSLCEALGQPDRFAARAEALWSAVRRVRFFAEKVLAFTGREPTTVTPTDVRGLLVGLRQEILDHSAGNLEVAVTCADTLPTALADPAALRSAILFLVETLLAVEPEASVLSLRAHPRFLDEDRSQVEIEVQAQCTEAHDLRTQPPTTMQLGFIAARNLVEAQHGTLAFEHTPGLDATACIALATSEERSAPQRDGPDAPAAPHRFGGVLVLARDASIRTLLAQEIERHGRNILSIGDSAAARALFERTPERFELLVLEHSALQAPAEQLARDALTHNDEVKVLFLAQKEGVLGQVPEPMRGRCAVVDKPFGLLELREAISRLLGTPVVA